MTIRAFEPKFMRVGVLSAALQELTPRDIRDADPDRAIEDWIAYAKELGADELQLSAALHPSEADVPPEAMLDPVANTLDLRKPLDAARARRVQTALSSTGIALSVGAIYLAIWVIESFIYPIPERVKQGIWVIVLLLALIALITIMTTGSISSFRFPVVR